MREIKFRVWDKNKEKMFSHHDLFSMDCSTDYPFLALIKGYYADYGARFLDGIDPITMQYTGLKDKNGTEIYEGDILKRVVTIVVYGSGNPPEDIEEFLQVDYKKEYAGFFVGETPLYYVVGARYDHDTKCRCTDVEVIGNIYENPELLEVD